MGLSKELIYCCVWVDEADFEFVVWKDGYSWFQFDRIILISQGPSLSNSLGRFPPRSFCSMFILWYTCWGHSSAGLRAGVLTLQGFKI